MSGIEFDAAFAGLTDHRPMRWQRRLFERLRSGEIPAVCDLPTGLGKTAVIAIWMIALAWQAQRGSVSLPRRLMYVVNRRTVVDQATSVVERIRERLLAPDDSRWHGHREALGAMAEALKGLAFAEDPFLGVSTLRGELADNEEWKADPARPAIVVGTIDMIGSKLLFNGYGDGRYGRAQHAGLVGQDSLVIHDEAHLTPAFSDLLHQLVAVQSHNGEPRPVQVMELSATPRGSSGPVLELEAEDESDKVVTDRLDAKKHLYLHEVATDLEGKRAEAFKKTQEKAVELSLKHRDTRAKVLIYVRSPDDAQEILGLLSERLGNGGEKRVALLTGTIRGHERDKLVREDPVYQAFLDPSFQVERTVYLVSTSAGEVGIDIDAHHMVCDLTTLDSMIQRLGRVNRRGGRGREARVDVLVQTGGQDTRDSPFKEAIETTGAILDDWSVGSNGPLDGSPRNLRRLLDGLDGERRQKAFAPKGTAPPLTDILLDAWSLTSVSGPMPGRPQVASYLHGLERHPPETYVAWRKEAALLTDANVDEQALGDWFQACRVEAQERLRDRADRVRNKLETLLTNHRKRNPNRDFPVVLLNERGEAEWKFLSEVVEKGFPLAYRTLVLPVEAGGLSRSGVLDADAMEPTPDVAEEKAAAGNAQRRQRWLLIRDADGERYERLVNGERTESPSPGLIERERATLQEAPEGAEEEGHGRYLLLMAERSRPPLDNPEEARVEQTLSVHGQRIDKIMGGIADRVGLNATMKEALTLAAEWHDRGKNRPVWQRYACNRGGEPLAKSTKYLHGRDLGGYRHEFGSLLEAGAEDKIRKHPEADLIWHLIAAHHGWGRPHFEINARDNIRTTAENEEAAAEVMRRFGRLQQRFGRWGLAWLESVVRCADIAASKEVSQ